MSSNEFPAGPAGGIPARTSSIRATSPRKRQWEEEQENIQKELVEVRKKLKPQGSFSAEFWTSATRLAELEQQNTVLRKKLSMREFAGTMTEWEKTKEAEELFVQERALQLEEATCKKQADRVTKSGDSVLEKSWMKLFITSKMGAAICETGAGRQGQGVHSQFRAALIEKYNSRQPERQADFHWCPILHKYQKKVTAAHLFSYKHGEDIMEAIFGPDSAGELFSPKNGMIVSEEFESVFDKGLLAIVPDPEDDSPKSLQKWVNSEPKNYKIKILDFAHPLAKVDIDTGNDQEIIRWEDLEGRKLEFKTDFRPRARYLYFHYCLQILRVSWNDHVRKRACGTTIKKECGKTFWGTNGSYVPKYMIKALIAHVGHEYSHMVEEGIEGEEKYEGEGDLFPTVLADQAKVEAKNEDEELDEGLDGLEL